MLQNESDLLVSFGFNVSSVSKFVLGLFVIHCGLSHKREPDEKPIH